MATTMVDITESVEIAAPPERVWALVCDFARHPEYAGSKSITKKVDFTGPARGGDRFIAHERFGPQKFDAPSDITVVEANRDLAWESFPPMKDENRGDGGKVLWSYHLEPQGTGTRLTHRMQVLEPAKGVLPLKIMYAVFRLPAKQRAGVLTTLANIKRVAETGS
jgi:uncharacterized protein YndB with AHSA1/START domain